MKHIRIWVWILCACFVSVAWSQQSASNPLADWTEFDRPNMRCWNSYEHLLGDQGMCWSSGNVLCQTKFISRS